MFRGHELHYVAVGKRGTDGVRAGRGFAPTATGDKVDAREPAAHVLIADQAQDAARCIGQHDHVPRVGQQIGEMLHDRAGGLQKLGVGFPTLVELGVVGDDVWCKP